MLEMPKMWGRYNDTLYEVSTYGEVRDVSTGKLLASKQCNRGTHMCNSVVLCIPNKDGSVNTIEKYIDDMVAERFLPNPFNLDMIEHINNDYLDDRVCNLRWCSAK